MHAWMKPDSGIHNEEECNISKCLLFGIINSKGLKKYFIPNAIKELNQYINIKILKHKSVTSIDPANIIILSNFHTVELVHGGSICQANVTDRGKKNYLIWNDIALVALYHHIFIGRG